MTDGKILQLPKKTKNPYLADTPKEAQGTDAYPMVMLNYTQAPLTTVPDIANGSERNKKWGAVFSIGILPGLDGTKPGPALIPVMPAHLIDSESLDALRARIIYEIDKAIELARLQMEDPLEYQKCESEFLAHLEKSSKVGV